MKFFLADRGLKLAKFSDQHVEVEEQKIDSPVTPNLPYISPLGFEVNQKVLPGIDFDPLSEHVREKVFKSFAKMAVFVQDTKSILDFKLRITADNVLMVMVQSINQVCSKLHVEDISPLEQKICNHEVVGCTQAHFNDNSMLVEPTDLVVCKKDDAIFRVRDGYLHMMSHKKWVKLDIEPQIKDEYYMVILDNFK
jgi:hypothetical protein